MGFYGDNGKENGNYYNILELYRDNGKENGNYSNILELYRDNGKENGNYSNILELYRDNGKENGNYYLGFRVLKKVETVIMGYIGVLWGSIGFYKVIWGLYRVILEWRTSLELRALAFRASGLEAPKPFWSLGFSG